MTCSTFLGGGVTDNEFNKYIKTEQNLERFELSRSEPVVGLLLRCCWPSAFAIAYRHVTVNALVAGRFHHQLLSIAPAAAAATAAGPPPPPSPPPLSNSPSSIAKERQQ